MGILIRQVDKDWLIELKEEWRIEDKKEALKFVEFLLEEELKTEIYHCNGYYFDFEKTSKRFEKYDDMFRVLKKLLDYKKRYGSIR